MAWGIVLPIFRFVVIPVRRHLRRAIRGRFAWAGASTYSDPSPFGDRLYCRGRLGAGRGHSVAATIVELDEILKWSLTKSLRADGKRTESRGNANRSSGEGPRGS